jgi:RimJ/RimL family protein N-acetyltransferase
VYKIKRNLKLVLRDLLMLPEFKRTILESPFGEIALRLAERNDARALNQIINEPEVNKFVLVEAPVSLRSTIWAIEKASRGSPWIVCEADEQIVGSITIEGFPGRESHVAKFGIAFSKKVHGNGMAASAMEFCLLWLKENGVEKIISEVFECNTRGRAFYKKLGFQELCILKKQVKRKEKYENAFLIEKFL